MSRPPRYYDPGQLRFITSSTYRRTPAFQSPRFCEEFVPGSFRHCGKNSDLADRLGADAGPFSFASEAETGGVHPADLPAAQAGAPASAPQGPARESPKRMVPGDGSRRRAVSSLAAAVLSVQCVQ